MSEPRSRKTRPAPPDGPSCADCRYWSEQTVATDDERWGQCQANPPTVVSDGDGTYCVVAWTELPYLCRHHAPKTH